MLGTLEATFRVAAFMSSQRIPIDALQKIRQYLKSALMVPSENVPVWPTEEPPPPDSIDDLSRLFYIGSNPTVAPPTPNPQGRWFVSITNPGAALLKLPGLRVKTGFRLIGYLYRDGEKGSGVVWAVPEALSTIAQLEKALLSSTDPPKPEGALANFMNAIEGDQSRLSFVIASILRRELLEFGAIGTGKSWGHHRLIERVPVHVPMQWQAQPVKDFAPKVSVDGGQITIQFFTVRSVSQGVVIFEHVDRYRAGDYQASEISSYAVVHSTNRAIATIEQSRN